MQRVNELPSAFGNRGDTYGHLSRQPEPILSPFYRWQSSKFQRVRKLNHGTTVFHSCLYRTLYEYLLCAVWAGVWYVPTLRLFCDTHSSASITSCPEVFLFNGVGGGGYHSHRKAVFLGNMGNWSRHPGTHREGLSDRQRACSHLTLPILSRTTSSSEDTARELPAVRDLKKLEFA